MKYFTSDQHFFDTDIMAFSNRPYGSPEEMNEDIIAKFLDTTRDADEVYILGDMFGSKRPADQFGELSRIMKRLGINERPFYLMRGNHDHLTDDEYKKMGFRSVMRNFAFIELKNGMNAMISHDPCMIQPKNTLAVCGHVHTLFKELWNAERGTLALNVSVEVRDYRPMSEDEVLAAAEGYPYRQAAGGFSR